MCDGGKACFPVLSPHLKPFNSQTCPNLPTRLRGATAEYLLFPPTLASTGSSQVLCSTCLRAKEKDEALIASNTMRLRN